MSHDGYVEKAIMMYNVYQAQKGAVLRAQNHQGAVNATSPDTRPNAPYLHSL